jgi:SAM-dependent methyltransferase
VGGPILPRGFGLAAADYAKHRHGFPPSLLDRLADHEIGRPGQVVVDLGTGTGTLARQFAQRSCASIGIDPDPRMLEAARQLALEESIPIAAGEDPVGPGEVCFRQSTAEATELPSASADVVTAGQCWHWFDRRSAAREASRLLRASGRLVVCHFDWIPLDGNLVEATEALIRHHNSAWKLGGGHGMYPQWAREVREAGFFGLETFGFDVASRYTPDGWRGRVRASAGITALDAEERDRFDRELGELLARQFPGDHLEIDHRVWALIATRGT